MFSADTECARLMRDHDWSGSPLGTPEGWPVELRTLVAVMLESRQPMCVIWGPEEIILYNDAYGLLCGARHPAMGVPFRALWFDIMEEVGPILRAAYDGQSTHVSDMAFVMHRNGYPEEAYVSFSYTPVRGAAHEVLGVFGVCTETTDQVFARRVQEHERELLDETLRLSPGATALLLGPDHVLTFANERYLELIARGSEVLGMTVAEALPEVVGQGFIDLLDRVYTTGEPYIGRDVEIDLPGGPGAPLKRFTLDFVYQPFRDPMGERRGVLVQAVDVTDRQERERRQGILTTELSHRMKNQLAVVRAIVSQTLRSATDIRDAARTIDGRLMALSRAQQLLFSGASEEGSVECVVRGALAAYGEGEPAPYTLSGPHVVLNPQLVMSLALVLHELATNALKYGAFSVPGGHVSIAWDMEAAAEGRFVFDWRETGGPVVSPPLRRGTGSRLIAAGLDTFDGEVRMDFAPEGLHCRMTAILPRRDGL